MPLPAGSDNFEDAPIVTDSITASGLFSNIGYTRQTNEPGPRPHRTAWWRLHPPVAGSYVIDSIGGTGDTMIQVFAVTDAGGPAIDNMFLLGSDDDSGGSSRSQLTVNLTPGTIYYVQLGSYYDEDVDYILNILGPEYTPPGSSGSGGATELKFMWDGTQWAPLGGGGTTILSGNVPPVDATGVVGNYYLDKKDNVLYGPKASKEATTIGPLDTVADPFISEYFGAFRIATEFQIEQAKDIVGLRFWRHADSGLTSRVLELWVEETFTIAAPATTEEAGYEGWVTAMLPIPVPVAAFDYVMVVTTENIVTHAWQMNQPVPAPRFVYEECWSADTAIGVPGYPGNTHWSDWTFPLDFLIEDVLDPTWVDNVISDRTRGVWEFAGQYYYPDVSFPDPVPPGQFITVGSAPDPITGKRTYEYHLAGYDAHGVDRTSYWASGFSGDSIVFHELSNHTETYECKTLARIGFMDSAPGIGGDVYDTYVTVENDWHHNPGFKYEIYPINKIDELNEGVEAYYWYRGPTNFYTQYISDFHLSIDKDPSTVTEPGTPALLCTGTHSLGGLRSTHLVNGISAGDSILLSVHDDDVVVTTTSYKARVAGESFYSWANGYCIPLLLDPPPTGKEMPGTGLRVRLRVAPNAMSGTHGMAGFMGAWVSTKYYPPGSIVTYGGFTWGTEMGAPKGFVPTDVPVNPAGTLNIYNGSNTIAGAPSIQIPPGNTYCESLYHYGGSFNSEANEPNGVNTMAHSSRTIWWKYLPTLSGTFGIQAKERDYNYPCNIDVFQLRAPTYTAFTDLTLIGGTHSIMYEISPITVTLGNTYYLRLCARMVDYLYYRMQLTKALPTSPIDYWVKI